MTSKKSFYKELVQLDEISVLVLNPAKIAGSFDQITPDQLQQGLDYNIYSFGILTKIMTKQFYNRALRGEKSALITVAPSLGFQPVTGYFYGVGSTLENATKAFILYFTLSVGKEMRDERFVKQQKKMIDTICLCPGPIQTKLSIFDVQASLRDLCFQSITTNQLWISRGNFINL